MRRMTPCEWYVMYGGEQIEREVAREEAARLAKMTPEEIEADRIKNAENVKKIEVFLTLTICGFLLYCFTIAPLFVN